MRGGITISRVLDSANLWTSTGQSAFFDIAAWSLGASLGSLCRTGPRGNRKSGDMWACWVTERWLLCVWQFSRSFVRFWISKDCNWTLVAGSEVDILNNVYNKPFASDRLNKQIVLADFAAGLCSAAAAEVLMLSECLKIDKWVCHTAGWTSYPRCQQNQDLDSCCAMRSFESSAWSNPPVDLMCMCVDRVCTVYKVHLLHFYNMFTRSNKYHHWFLTGRWLHTPNISIPVHAKLTHNVRMSEFKVNKSSVMDMILYHDVLTHPDWFFASLHVAGGSGLPGPGAQRRSLVVYEVSLEARRLSRVVSEFFRGIKLAGNRVKYFEYVFMSYCFSWMLVELLCVMYAIHNN